MRIIIIGNSGSGKTWLARLLSEKFHLQAVHLDNIFWEPGGFDVKRPKNEVYRMINEEIGRDKWIVEGVFGELAQMCLGRALLLIWLDIPWDVCKQRLENRGSESKMHMGRVEHEDGLKKLIKWASEYEIRTDMRSRIGHSMIYENYKYEKYRVDNNDELLKVINRLSRG